MGFFSQPVPSIGQEMGQVTGSALKGFPGLANLLSEYLNKGTMEGAQNNLAAQQATSGATNELMQNLYAQYGPAMAQIGANIGKQTQQNQVNANADVANSAGGQAALAANIAADKAANPEFYASRAAASSRLGDLLNSIDLSGKLSGGETRAIDQSLAQQNMRTGTVNAPSAANTVSNAMQYGNASYNRQEQAKSDLNNAIGQATSFLPASKSGVDAWQTATGGPSTTSNMANSGMSLFSGLTNPTATSNNNSLSNVLTSLLGGGAGMGSQQIGSTANKSTGLDQAMQTAQGIGQVAAMVGAAV